MPDGGAYLGRTTLILDADAEPLDRELAEAKARAELANREMARQAKIATDEIVRDSKRGVAAFADEGKAVEGVTEKMRKSSADRVQADRQVETQRGKTSRVVHDAATKEAKDNKDAIELERLREQMQGRLANAEKDASEARQRAHTRDRNLNRDALNEYKKLEDAKAQGRRVTKDDLAAANQRIQARRDEAAHNRTIAEQFEREAVNMRGLLRDLDSLTAERKKAIAVQRDQSGHVAEGRNMADQLRATKAAADEIKRVTDYTNTWDRKLADTTRGIQQIDGALGEHLHTLRQVAAATDSINSMPIFTARSQAVKDIARQQQIVRERELATVIPPPTLIERSSPAGPIGGPGADFAPRVQLPPDQSRGFRQDLGYAAMTEAEKEAEKRYWAAERRAWEMDQALLSRGKRSLQLSGLGSPFAQGGDPMLEMFHGMPGDIDPMKILREGLGPPGAGLKAGGAYLSPDAHRSLQFSRVLGWLFRVRADRASDVGIRRGEEASPGLDKGEMITADTINPRHIELMDRTMLAVEEKVAEKLYKRAPKAFEHPIPSDEDLAGFGGYTINLARAKELHSAVKAQIKGGDKDPELIELRRDLGNWIKNFQAFQRGKGVEGVKGPDKVGSRQNPETVVLKSGRSAGLAASESAEIARDSATDHPMERGAVREAFGYGRGPAIRQPFAVGQHMVVDISDQSMSRFHDGMQASILEPLRNMVAGLTGQPQAGQGQFALESTGRQHQLYQVGPEGRRLLAESSSMDAIKAAMKQAQMSQTRNEYGLARAMQHIAETRGIPIGERPRYGEGPKKGQPMSDAAIIRQAKRETSDKELVRALRDNTVATEESTRAARDEAHAALIAAAANRHQEMFGAGNLASAGGGEGGGGLPPVALGGGGERSPGHPFSLGLAGALMGRKHSHGRPPGWLGYLLGPAIGAGAAAGSIASFAGFGTEHILTTLGGIAGSGVAAGAGAGLMGLGAAGQFAVGGGSDALVMRSTIAQTKELQTSYQKVQEAVAKYGAGSKQAVVAQNALNFAMKEMGGGSAVAAELRLAKAETALKKFWDHATSGARVNATKVLSQVLSLGRSYIPLVARSAEQNLSIIDDRIKPLMSWLKGPEGMGIFKTLERRFQEHLPTAIHAATMGIELFLKTIREMSQYTGGLTQKLDVFLTKANSPEGFAKWRSEMGRLVATTRDWGAFLNIAWKVLRDLFSQDAETGRGIIKSLTTMLTKLHEWEVGTRGKAQITNLFLVHKEEVLALLHLIAPLSSMFGSLYLAIAPALTQVATTLARMLGLLGKLSPTLLTVFGGALVLAKLGYLKAVLTGVGRAFGVIGSTAASTGSKAALGLDAQAAAADRAAAATTRLAGAEAEAAAAAKWQYAVPGVGVTRVPGFGQRAMVPGMGPQGFTAEEQMLAAERAAPTPIGILGRTKASIGGGIGTLTSAARDLGPKLLRGGTYGLMAGIGADAITSAIPGLHKNVKNALTGAISGAATGAAFGPWGAAAGLVIGGALGGAFSLFSHKAKDYGKDFAHQFAAPLSATITTRALADDEKRLKESANKAGSARRAYEELANPIKFGKADYSRSGNRPLVSPVDLKAAFDKRFTAEQQQGLTAAEVAKEQFGGVTHKTTFQLEKFAGFEMSKLTGQVRNSAGKAMVAYAAELEAKKELPKGAMGRVLDALKTQFPGFRHWIEKQGSGTAKAFGEAMRLQHAQSTLATSLNNMRVSWGLFNIDEKVTGATWIKNSGTALKDLKTIYAHSGGEAKKEALKQIEELERENHTVLGRMLTRTKAQMAKYAPMIAGGLSGAKPAAERELGKFVTAVIEAEKAGAISAELGAKMITEATNAELTAVGASGAKVPKPNLQPMVFPAPKTGGAGAAFGPGLAGGGLLQVGNHGEAGHDNIPLNVGGHPIVVGAGEQVAVFNRHQQEVMDHALHGWGGLHGMFSKVNTPHYMASGGFAPGLGGVDTGVATVVTALLKQFPGLGITSTTGGHHATGSLHYLKEAVDVGGAAKLMYQAAKWLGGTWGRSLEEGIHNPDLSIKHGHGVPPSFWGEPTWAQHLNHIHIGVLGGKALPGGAGGGEGGGAVWKAIKAPKVSGDSKLAHSINTALAKMARSADTYGRKQLGSTPGSSGGTAAGTAQMRRWAAAGLRAAGVSASPHNVSTIVARMMQESGGNPRSENRWDSNFLAGHPSKGLMEMVPENFAKYHVAGTSNDPFDPVANVAASVRYMLARYHHLVGSGSGGYAKGGVVGGRPNMGCVGCGGAGCHMCEGGMLHFASGGLMPGYFKGTAKATTASTKKAAKVKRATPRHMHSAKRIGKLSLGKLRATLNAIPGYGAITKTLKDPEEEANALDSELGLLSEMAQNPATLLAEDRGTVKPYMPADLDLPTGELITATQRRIASYELSHGPSDALAETSSLVNWIGEKDDHRLISKGQAGLLHLKGFLPFAAGIGVFPSQEAVVAREKVVYEKVSEIEKAQLNKVAAFINAREKRMARTRRHLAKVYAHYHKLHHQLELVKLKAAKQKFNMTEAANTASAAEADIGALIADEKTAPKGEQNTQLIEHLRAQQATMRSHAASLRRASRYPVIEQELKMQIHPVEETLHALGGASTHIGQAGRLGELGKQVKALTHAKGELEQKHETTEKSTLPKLSLQLEALKEQLANSAASVRPPKVTSGTTAPTEKQTLEKERTQTLQKELAVSQAQYKVLASLPKFGGHFAAGGVVPGLMGEPRTIVAHGGETVLKPGQARPQVNVNVADGMSWLRKFIKVEYQEHSKSHARAAYRSLPGRGGGI